MNNDNVLIRLESIAKIYTMGEYQVKALYGISYIIKQGDFVAIMGPSGSGKSTLLNILGCLDKPTEGKYYLENEEISTFDKNKLAQIRNKKIGFVFQHFNLLARTTALENTELPLLYSSVPARSSRELALKALAAVGLEGREHHKTNQLSGGEQQRVAIARALVNNPSLILADEPTGNLDTRTGEEILDIFRKLNKEKNITIILVTHAMELVQCANKIMFIRDGQLVKEQQKERRNEFIENNTIIIPSVEQK